MSARITLAVAGIAALAFPLPALTTLGIVLTISGLLALAYSCAVPGSSAPAVLIAAAALSWLGATSGPHHLLRLGGLALAIAVVHTSAALAAVVPARARIPATVLLRWAAWTIAATALGMGALVAASLLRATGALPVTVTAVLVTATWGVLLVLRGTRSAGPSPGGAGYPP